MRREPLLLPAISLAAGILTAHFFYFVPRNLAVPAGIAAAVSLASFSLQSAKRLRLTSVCLSMALLGIGSQVQHRSTRHPKLDVADGDTALLSGCVVDPPVYREGRAQFSLKLGPGAIARVSVVLPDGQRLPLRYGQRVDAAGKVRLPRNFGNPGAFDYAGYLAARDIFWTASVSAPTDIQISKGSCGWAPAGWVYSIRDAALDRLQRLYPDDPHTAGLLGATLLGQTAGIERRWTAEFRATGTYHAIVISGLHVWVVTGALLLLLRLLQVPRLPALTIASLVAWFYALLAGFNAPVVRSAAGFTLFLLASLVFRRTRILNLLAAVAIIYLLCAPEQLFDPSFQLSFLSAAAIGVFAIPAIERYVLPLRNAVKRFGQVSFDPAVETRAAIWRVELRLLAETLQLCTGLSLSRAQSVVAGATRVWVFLAEAIVLTACVQFALALPMIAFFHRLSATGLSSNVLVVPVLSVMIPVGFAALFSGWHVLAALTKALLSLAEMLTSWHMHFEPSWRIAGVPLGLGLLFCVLLILLALAVRHYRMAILPTLAAALLLFCLFIIQPWKPTMQNGSLEVTSIDVGQGDSELVVFPNGETMLLDAGGFPGMERMQHKPQMDIGEDVVSPYLWSRQIHKLDYAVLTHGHSDHMGGLPAVLDNFHPRVLWAGAEPESAEWGLVREHARADGVRVESLCRRSPALVIGGVQVRILAPAPDYVPGEKASNNDSLVLELVLGKTSIVLTGDAERPVEQDMLNAGLLRQVTLLKVGHHGSRTSSSAEFLNQLMPRLAFISDGYQNQFHHPHPDVLERFAAVHTAVFRTDQHGLLTFLTDGNKVEVSTFR